MYSVVPEQVQPLADASIREGLLQGR
ncbi:hypothetical protein Avin_11750 [Azotobacter vinelandii DJ]|uniref:Uncharacterized protein n=1 Tax=Azotobacter vinelandii (strain DJ / ATCC BAA-1303) TaxID=322710 RepID=C1DPH2_AZOVD|nr:hypothetical protein Avin_11750 [Azotobacter vinelandii DJ]